MNIVRNALSWDISCTGYRDYISRGLSLSTCNHANTVGLCIGDPLDADYSDLLFMYSDIHEVWWRKDNHWEWVSLDMITHIWGAEYEHN